MSACDRLALEHLTAPAASPLQIVDLAASEGWGAATVLVSPFAAFPQTAGIDLVTDRAARNAVRRAAADGGVTIALAYPFVLTRRTDAASFARAVEAAADIGAEGIGLLVYERDAARADQELATLCELASRSGLRPVLEFFGGSSVRTLAEAEAIAGREPSASIKLCVDLLHLVRSGGDIADLAAVRTPILHAQLSDAPLFPQLERDAEAAYGRLPPGEGDFDVLGFAASIPEEAWLGVETPPAGGALGEGTAHARSVMRKARALFTPANERPAVGR